MHRQIAEFRIRAAHSCQWRRSGRPSNAIQLISDGAMITVNGDSGEILVLDEAA
jgi:hypothetical protein